MHLRVSTDCHDFGLWQRHPDLQRAPFRFEIWHHEDLSRNMCIRRTQLELYMPEPARLEDQRKLPTSLHACKKNAHQLSGTDQGQQQGILRAHVLALNPTACVQSAPPTHTEVKEELESEAPDCLASRKPSLILSSTHSESEDYCAIPLRSSFSLDPVQISFQMVFRFASRNTGELNFVLGIRST